MFTIIRIMCTIVINVDVTKLSEYEIEKIVLIISQQSSMSRLR